MTARIVNGDFHASLSCSCERPWSPRGWKASVLAGSARGAGQRQNRTAGTGQRGGALAITVRLSGGRSPQQTVMKSKSSSPAASTAQGGRKRTPRGRPRPPQTPTGVQGGGEEGGKGKGGACPRGGPRRGGRRSRRGRGGGGRPRPGPAPPPPPHRRRRQGRGVGRRGGSGERWLGAPPPPPPPEPLLEANPSLRGPGGGEGERGWRLIPHFGGPGGGEGGEREGGRERTTEGDGEDTRIEVDRRRERDAEGERGRGREGETESDEKRE